jgi:hypothetical protein
MWYKEGGLGFCDMDLLLATYVILSKCLTALGLIPSPGLDDQSRRSLASVLESLCAPMPIFGKNRAKDGTWERAPS